MLANNRGLPHRANAHGAAVRLFLLLFATILTYFCPTVRADITKWTDGSVIPGTEGIGTAGITATPFADLSPSGGTFDLTEANFINANLYHANLNNATLIHANMTGANLISANLTAATFNDATLSSPAIFTNAQIASANFSFATGLVLTNYGTLTGTGTTNAIGSLSFFTEQQLDSTKSYQVKDLIGVGFGSNDMSGWDLSHQNLAAANLSQGIYALYIDQSAGTYNVATDFTQTNLASAIATSSNFGNRNAGNPTFSGATFVQANLATANFSSGTFNGADFTDANLSYATFSSASFGQVPGVVVGTQTFSVWGGTISNAANFGNPTLSTGATINFANFSSDVSATASDRGFRKELLYQTISYQNHDLRGINLSNNDLTVGGNVGSVSTSGATTFTVSGGTWDFSGQNLTGANFSSSTLAINVSNLLTTGPTILGTGSTAVTYRTTRTANVNALFNGANLTSVNFSGATLAGTINGGGNLADFTDATINFANFSSTTAKGFRKEQLEQTASWKNQSLQGINLSSDNLTASGTTNIGWNFGSQDLTSANFSSAILTTTIGTNTFAANFAGATVAFANFSSTPALGFRKSQLEQTASWQNHSLQGINLSSDNLTASGTTNIGWDFDSQDLSFANFSGATLTTVVVINNSTTTFAADFSNATVNFANFSGTTAHGLTFAMLQSTANAQSMNSDFTGINLSSNTIPGANTGTNAWNFTNFNLTSASFTSSNLSTVTFSGATLTLASLNSANLTGASFDNVAMASANLSGANLTTANFAGSTLTFANLSSTRLLSVNFSNADLTGVNFSGATFSSSGSTSSDGPNLLHAIIKGANLSFATSRGFTFQMLNATDSYRNQDLTGTNFSNDDVSGWVFGDNTIVPHMDLSSVSFAGSTLTGVGGNAQFTHATIAFANFSQTTSRGLTESQLQDTDSWVNHDLRGINLSFNDLTNWDFSGQNLASANFSNASLSTGGTSNFADLSAANIVGANFSTTTSLGFTKEQLYSTQSYLDGDLSYVNFSFNTLAPVNPVNQAPLDAWDLSGQNLSGATFDSSILSNYDVSSGTPVLANSVTFTGAIIKDASFNSTTDKGFTKEQLYSTQSYADHNLGAIGLGSDDLSGWDLSNQNLNKANFAIATLDSTNFTGAKIAGANFTHTTPFGFTRDQLYSTYSYSNHSLGSINLSQNNLGSNATLLLAGWDFSNQYMPKANFSMSLLTQANFNDADLQDTTFTNAGLIQTTFDRADLRGATGFTGAQLSTNNTILPDGTIQGLDLTSTYPLSQRHLTIRDYNGATSIPVHITKQLSLDSTSTLQIRLHDGTWGSTVSFDPAITVQLAGVLDLGIDNQALSDPTLLTDIYNYPGHARPIQLFNWNSSPQSPHFDSIVEDPRFSWDTTDLYDGGTILVNGLYGDVNRDGRVDVADLFIIAQHWQQPTTLWSNGDMTDAGASNGIVDLADLQLLVNNWGFGVYDTTSPSGSNPPPALGPLLLSLGLPVVTVPEPVMGCPLMMLAAMTFLRRSRRSRK